jgi:N utilization substance protein A
MNQAEKSAKVIVPDKALSLAIGKEGQNARLAAKLTGWRIDIRSESDAADEIERLEAEAAAAAEQERERENARQAAAELLAQAEAGLAEEEAQAALEAEAEEVSPEAQPEALAAGQPAEGEDVGEPEADAEHKVDAMAEPALAPEHIDVPTKVVETAEDEAATGEAGEQLSEVDMIEADEWEEEEDEDGRPIKKDRRKRDRKRQLEFDERLGQVVARKKRRPGRDRNDWDDGEY